MTRLRDAHKRNDPDRRGAGAILMIDTEPLTEPGSENLRGFSSLLADHLASSDVPIILTGISPWRPTVLLEARPYEDRDQRAELRRAPDDVGAHVPRPQHATAR